MGCRDWRRLNGGSENVSQSKSMAAIAALFVMGVVGSVAWAQSADRDSCVDACHQAKAQCVDSCDTHDNPVECDEDCQDAAEDCIRQCR
jgi:adenylate cyclase